ncbi:transporter substrate-binding domain-containing protein [Duganella sp. FT92W]|uniref:Transporter substrate-binding domain-containing protein n=1 Tax=Pseudoduganella rivuli TaxID=2666085 RepID=A0A7X2IW18_9BURK|nr:transporter substrate-binding domain-containing protein [Pseudoduganella rivuli]MRV76837.1 transporter substrate-binding domain-containing protein [Pseudoduganella rivuli]
MMRRVVSAAMLAALLSGHAAAQQAQGSCSRDIQVPVALIGMSTTQLENGSVGGIYPEALQHAVQKAGCKFVYSVVPRARLEVLFEMGKADVLIPASRTPARDKIGIFVPMISHRATLLSLAGGTRAPLTSAQDLLDRKELRVAVVRGYDFGEQYQWLVRELARQGRLYQEVDTVAIARLMQAGAIDVTIMGPTTFHGAVQRDPRVAGLADRLRVEAIPELPWNWSGAYVSRQSLSQEDQAAVRDLIERVAKSPAILEGFQRTYRADLLAESVRPR